MRNGALRGVLAALLVTASTVLVTATVLVACGGDESQRPTTPEWQPSQRTPRVSRGWWSEPVERYCEEDRECHADERCQLMRLGTCPQCPRGEDAKICVPRDSSQGAQARH